METTRQYFIILGIIIALCVACDLLGRLAPLIYNRFLVIKQWRQSIIDRIADQKAVQRSYKLLWNEASHLMCVLPTAEDILTEVNLKTLFMPQDNIDYFTKRAKQCSVDIHRIQACFGRLQKRISKHPPDLLFTAEQLDELKKLTTRMKARIQDIESLYRKIDRHLQEHREDNVNLPH